MVTIKVDVQNGTAPIPIKVYIDNLDNDHDIKFSKPGSFENGYNLEPGRYSILVGGMNNPNASTIITVYGACKDGPYPSGPQTCDTSTYSVFFYLEV